jgi:hypothetical protein
LARTALRVAKEQRLGSSDFGNQASSFKFWLKERLFGLEKGSKGRSAHKFHDNTT